MVRSRWNANGIPLRRGCTDKLPAKRLDTAICWEPVAWGYSPQQHPLRRGVTHSLRTGSVCQRGLRPPLDYPSREAHLNMYLQNFLRLLSETPPLPFTHLPTFPVRISYPNGYPNTRCIMYHSITQKSKRCPTRIHACTVLGIFYNKKVHQPNLYPNSFHSFAARLAGLQR